MRTYTVFPCDIYEHDTIAAAAAAAAVDALDLFPENDRVY